MPGAATPFVTSTTPHADAAQSSAQTSAARDLREAEGDLSGAAGDEPGFFFEDHVYDGERCIRCGVNCYDAILYGPELCPGKSGAPPLVYTTSSGDPSVFGSDHALLEDGDRP